MTATRHRIAAFVVAHPGVHFNEVVRRTDFAPGQVQYHVRRLLGDGTLVSESLYGRTHYYPPNFDDWERGALALARRETARDVLIYLVETGASAPATVADAVGVARSTLEWHLDHLTERSLVEKRRDAGGRVTLVATRPAETVRLLSEIEPSLPERLLDRFERLVDEFLAE